MPLVATSSSRPTNGLTNVAPALAASSACAAENTSVTFTLMTFARQRLAGADAVAGQRHLDDHVRVDGRDVVSFAHHAGEVGRHHFAADRPLDDVADLLQVLAVVARLLRQQRRIRRHAVDDADERPASRCP